MGRAPGSRRGTDRDSIPRAWSRAALAPPAGSGLAEGTELRGAQSLTRPGCPAELVLQASVAPSLPQREEGRSPGRHGSHPQSPAPRVAPGLLPGNAQVSENQGRTPVMCLSIRIAIRFQCRKPAPKKPPGGLLPLPSGRSLARPGVHQAPWTAGW